MKSGPHWPENQVENGKVKPWPETQTCNPRLHWTDHIDAAITDLRNSDRSPFEQRVYDALRLLFGQEK